MNDNDSERMTRNDDNNSDTTSDTTTTTTTTTTTGPKTTSNSVLEGSKSNLHFLISIKENLETILNSVEKRLLKLNL